MKVLILQESYITSIESALDLYDPLCVANFHIRHQNQGQTNYNTSVNNRREVLNSVNLSTRGQAFRPIISTRINPQNTTNSICVNLLLSLPLHK